MDNSILSAYADLLVESGLNPDPGQDVVINAGFDQLDFVRMVTEKLYRRGVAKVWFNWQDMPLEKLHNIYQSEERLGSLENWEVEKLRWQADKLPARLVILSEDPDGMAGADQGKRARAQAKRYPLIKPFRDAMENRYQWCIAAVPGIQWARKVFPGVSDGDAVEKLWDAILSASRAKGDPIGNWQRHNAEIHRRAELLNSYRFTALEYHSGNGTDFRVGLMNESIFCGGAEKDLSGRVFNPNIPSEELFTTPRSGDAEGVLVSTMPLSYMGSLIENFSVRFENGRAVEVKAEKNQDVLEKMVAMDDGAAKLGEVALIGCDSPINQSGILFYNTLFDENASCHFAFGKGYDVCVRDYAKYSAAELQTLGVNDSMIHVDFMVGCEDLSIDGITADGRKVAVFRQGKWCF